MSRLPLLLAVVAAMLFVAFGGTRHVGLSELAGNFRWMRDAADAAGEGAPLLFVAANIAVLMLLVVPSWFCTIAAGLLFGRWFGTLYALAGTTAGAAAVFLIARSGLGGLADRAGPRVASIGGALRADGIFYLVFMRLLPVLPFTLVNVVAALAGLRLQTFLIGTFIGIVPSVVIYANVGDLLMELTTSETLPDTNLLREPRFFLPLLGLAALALLPIIVRHWCRR
jgi:uncharacterized membrane protein YdjX (TVP38/TMEM64 family)